MLQVVKLEKDKEKDYTKFLLSHNNSLIYYSLRYRDLIKKITKADPLYLIVLDESKIRAVFPLMIKNGPDGKVINSLPYYGSNGGILSDSEEAKELLLSYYNNLILRSEFISSTVILNPFESSIKSNKFKHNEVDYRIGQFTFLRSNYIDIEDLISDFHSKTRNMVRKAIKSNITIDIDNKQWDFLKKTHFENMKIINGKSKSKEFFEYSKNIFRESEDYNIFVARKDNEVISALLVLYYNETVEYFTPVIKHEYRSLQPLSLIISTAMIHASNTGYKKWNWGGTWESQEGVYRFKSRWNSKDYKYHYLINVNKTEIYNYSIEKLSKDYEGFYVFPFSKLKKNGPPGIK